MQQGELTRYLNGTGGTAVPLPRRLLPVLACRHMNRRFAKLYLILFAVALAWFALDILDWALSLARGSVEAFVAWKETLESAGAPPRLSMDKLFGFAIHFVVLAAFAGVFLGPKLYGVRLAWVTVRERPLKTGLLCGFAALASFVCLSVELICLWFVTGALSPAISCTLLVALDVMLWLMLCSSDRASTPENCEAS